MRGKVNGEMTRRVQILHRWLRTVGSVTPGDTSRPRHSEVLHQLDIRRKEGKKVAAEGKTSQRLTTGSAGFPILSRKSIQAQLSRKQPFFSS